MNPFKDHFSDHALQYAAARPHYPDALIDHVSSQATAHDLAWDVATGNGQAAIGLARHFAEVHASDASIDQIRAAEPCPGVCFACEPAEHCSLPDHSVDLITVAQAAHWFDHDRFYAEVRRVARPGALLAIWCYGVHRVSTHIDPAVHHFYSEVVGPYWPPERRYIDDRYNTLPFPFEQRPSPGFEMRVEWSLGQFLDYLRSWSASQRFIKERGFDPLKPLTEHLTVAWGADLRPVCWPIHLKLATITE